MPLSVLDLSPVLSGGTPAQAPRDTLDLARAADTLGYHRYWLAEHHLVPGVVSSTPSVLIAAVTATTRRIRVGSGAVLLGHRTALDVAEQLGTLAGLHPDRIDLGVGRSGHLASTRAPSRRNPGRDRVVGGLLLPAPCPVARLVASPRFAAQGALLRQQGAQADPFAEQLDAILALVQGTFRTPDGVLVESAAASAGRPEVWVLGSSAGESARVAASAVYRSGPTTT